MQERKRARSLLYDPKDHWLLSHKMLVNRSFSQPKFSWPHTRNSLFFVTGDKLALFKTNFPPERFFLSPFFLLFCSFLVLIMRDSSATFIVEIGRHQIGTYGSFFFFFLNRKYPILVCHMMMMMMTLYKLRVFTYNGLQRSYHCFSWTIFSFSNVEHYHSTIRCMRYKSLVLFKWDFLYLYRS